MNEEHSSSGKRLREREATSRVKRARVDEEEEETPLAEKRWTVNGAITPQTRNGYYFMDTTAGNAPIIDQIEQNKRTWMMVYGPRGGGKTTRIYQACERLRELKYHCAVISFQSVAFWNGISDFWTSVGRQLHARLVPSQVNAPMTTSAHFCDFWRNLQRVVLVVDELDLLYLAPTLIRDDFLNALRALKQDDNAHGLAAFIAVGPFSILKISNLSAPPFNVYDALPIPRFLLADVRDLFQQYTQTAHIELASEIPDAIYQLTNGHAGLVCFCGKKISEDLAQGSLKVSYEGWVNFVATELVPSLRTEWATMAGLLRAINSYTELATKARQFLIDQFLVQDPLYDDQDSDSDGENESDDNPEVTDFLRVFAATNDNEIAQCEYLASEGILRSEGHNRFALASFLVRNLVTWAIRSVDPASLPTLPIPWLEPETGGEGLSMFCVLRECLKLFNASRMKEARFVSSKLPRRANLHKAVPAEAVYHYELFLALDNWLNKYFNVSSEVNAPMSRPGRRRRVNRQRCDLLLAKKYGDWKCVIELCASETVRAIEDHFDQAQAYGLALSANETWVINFDVSLHDQQPEPVWPRTPAASLHVVHVVHDADWTAAQVYYRNPMGNETCTRLVFSA